MGKLLALLLGLILAGSVLAREAPTVAADPTGAVAALYREIARKTAAQLALHARSKAIAFPKIVIQNT